MRRYHISGYYYRKSAPKSRFNSTLPFRSNLSTLILIIRGTVLQTIKRLITFCTSLLTYSRVCYRSPARRRHFLHIVAHIFAVLEKKKKKSALPDGRKISFSPWSNLQLSRSESIELSMAEPCFSFPFFFPRVSLSSSSSSSSSSHARP
jgi:hypothetical protein